METRSCERVFFAHSWARSSRLSGASDRSPNTLLNQVGFHFSALGLGARAWAAHRIDPNDTTQVKRAFFTHSWARSSRLGGASDRSCDTTRVSGSLCPLLGSVLAPGRRIESILRHHASQRVLFAHSWARSSRLGGASDRSYDTMQVKRAFE